MMLLKLLLNALILIGATAFFTDEKLEKDTNSATIKYHLPGYIIPNHYDIDIISHKSYELEVESFFGTCVPYIKINRPTHNISLHAQKPQIEVTVFKALEDMSRIFPFPDKRINVIKVNYNIFLLINVTYYILIVAYKTLIFYILVNYTGMCMVLHFGKQKLFLT